MRKLILTVGLPRSGKTTWAMAQGYPVVNPDSIRTALHGQRFVQAAEQMVWAIAEYMVKALFHVGHDVVIVDATNITSVRRERWLRIAAICGAVVDYEYVLTPPGECVRRAKAEGDEEIVPVIARMAEEWDLTKPDAWLAEEVAW